MTEPKHTAEPIAIVGMSVHVPGARSLEAFWSMLREGRDPLAETTEERFSLERYFDPRFAVSGKFNSRVLGYAEGIDRYDRAFFGMSRAEAQRTDPLQFMALELAFLALEDAGIDVSSLSGSKTAVFVGAGASEAKALSVQHYDVSNAHSLMGLSASIIANRISYVLDARGPSAVIDTGCSASLVALEMAMQSLRSGASDLALIGGVNALFSPDTHALFGLLGLLSPSGRCRSFDAQADGMVRSDGGAFLVLKRARDAAGHRVYSHVLSARVAQNGRGRGLSAPPSVDSQVALLRAAYADAGVHPDEVCVVEANATGSPAGDGPELHALAEVFAGRLAPPVWLGSVDSTVGHSEAGAGVTAIVKMSLMLHYSYIAKTLHVETPLAAIDWQAAPLRLARDSQALRVPDAGAGRVIGGVSKFGFGGTNAHVVLQGVTPTAAAAPDGRTISVLGFSARSAAALSAQATAYAELLRDRHAFVQVAAAAQAERSRFDQRAAVFGEAAPGLVAVARGEGSRSAVVGRVVAAPELAFFFAGHGPRWEGAGRALLAADARVAAKFAALAELADATALSAIAQGAPGEPSPRVLYPFVVALQLAIAHALAERGVRPSVVLGANLGELSAAAVAGVLSEADAMQLACASGAALEAAVGSGGLLSVVAPAELAETLARQHALQRVSSLADAQHVFAGAGAALMECARAIEAAGYLAYPLPVSVPYQSSLVAAPLASAAAALTRVQADSPRIVWLSSLTGAREHVAQPQHWLRLLGAPSQLATPLQTDEWRRASAVIELGPSFMLQPAPGGADRALATSADGYARALALAWVQGAPAQLSLEPHTPGSVPLPRYPFQRERIWHFQELMGEASPAQASAEPTTAAAPRISLLSDAAAPMPDAALSELMLTTVRRVLRQESIGYDDDLFDFGASSISAMVLVHELGKAGVTLNIRHVSDNPTVRGLARVATTAADDADRLVSVGLTPWQRRAGGLVPEGDVQAQHGLLLRLPNVSADALGYALYDWSRAHDLWRLRYTRIGAQLFLGLLEDTAQLRVQRVRVEATEVAQAAASDALRRKPGVTVFLDDAGAPHHLLVAYPIALVEAHALARSVELLDHVLAGTPAARQTTLAEREGNGLLKIIGADDSFITKLERDSELDAVPALSLLRVVPFAPLGLRPPYPGAGAASSLRVLGAAGPVTLARGSHAALDQLGAPANV